MTGDINLALAYSGQWFSDPGEHSHDWKEKRVTAIWRQCVGCGAGELIQNKVGRLHGSTNRNLRKTWIGVSGKRHGNAGKKHPVSPENVERVEVIRRLLVDERLTLEQAGARLGITRERVRQISSKHLGISTRALRTEDAIDKRVNHTGTCAMCGATYPQPIGSGHEAFEKHWREAGHTKITSEQIERMTAIVADYDGGMLNNAIMAKYHCKASLIYRSLRYFGRKHNRRDDNRLATMPESYARHDAIAADLFKTDLSMRQIATKHGVSDALVHLVNRKHGLIRPVNAHKITPEVVAEMRRLRETGLLFEAIGKQLGWSEATVSRHIGARRH